MEAMAGTATPKGGCSMLGKGGAASAARKSGFSLPELLVVIAIIGLLMTASFGSMARAREQAKRTKAEAQLRELVNAWQQYYTTYGKWPWTGERDTTAATLDPIVNPDSPNNDFGLVFFNFSGTGAFNDPWGTPYRLTFGVPGNGDSERNLTTFETTVALPRRYNGGDR